jgi:hypothetical protein
VRQYESFKVFELLLRIKMMVIHKEYNTADSSNPRGVQTDIGAENGICINTAQLNFKRFSI